MTVLSEEILKDLEIARNVITTEDFSLVVVKYANTTHSIKL